MAVLTAGERQQVLEALIRRYAANHGPYSVTRDDVKAAIGAIDDFLDANAAAINNAFPEPFKSNMGANAKAAIVSVVAARRAGIL